MDKLIGFFKGDMCKGLLGKPKIFLIQSCRSDKKNQVDLTDSNLSTNITRIPIEADVLVGYSTVQGFIFCNL